MSSSTIDSFQFHSPLYPLSPLSIEFSRVRSIRIDLRSEPRDLIIRHIVENYFEKDEQNVVNKNKLFSTKATNDRMAEIIFLQLKEISRF